MESCKAGLENRVNAKEAQETLKMPRKKCHDASELGTQARFWVSWVQSQVTKQHTFKARNVAFVKRTSTLLATNIGSYSRIVPASIYEDNS